jgi:hypothetical protein
MSSRLLRWVHPRGHAREQHRDHLALPVLSRCIHSCYGRPSPHPLFCKCLRFISLCIKSIGLKGFYKQGMTLTPKSSSPLQISVASQTTLNSRVSTSPTVVLHFILSSISSAGSPANAFVEYLRPYFAGQTSSSSLLFKEFPISLSSLVDASAHRDNVMEFIRNLSP